MSEFEQKRRELAETAEFEERLRRELARVEAPAGFAERVMEASRVTMVPKAGVGAPRRVLMYAAAAVLVMAAVGGDHVRQEQRREQANEDFATAMQVTNRAMERAEEHALEQMQRAGVEMNDPTSGSGAKEERR